MVPPPAKTAKLTRKRNRKRKRRAASSSSSSDSESSSSDAESVALQPKIPEPAPPAESSESSSSSSSSSDSESDGDDADGPHKVAAARSPQGALQTQYRKVPSRSPSPQPTPIPSFLPQPGDSDAIEREKVLKEKFRKFWLSSVVDGFKDDLEEIRKEPNLDTKRLALLIESLASGGEVFSSSDKDDRGVNEMEVVVES